MKVASCMLHQPHICHHGLGPCSTHRHASTSQPPLSFYQAFKAVSYPLPSLLSVGLRWRLVL